MSTATTTSVFLTPRPFAQFSGRLLLLPLLPSKAAPLPELPSELWTTVFEFAAADTRNGSKTLWSLAYVSRRFKDLAIPVIYSNIQLSRVTAVGKLSSHLHAADTKWDDIRRISYSTPGRWIFSLDLTNIGGLGGARQALTLDTTLSSLFSLLPFLGHFRMSFSYILSRRALRALADREGSVNLKTIEGITYVPYEIYEPSSTEEALVHLVRRCPNLESLEVQGQGPDPLDIDEVFTLSPSPASLPSFQPLNLPHLRFLAMLSMHASPLMLALMSSPLPSLSKLTITPYNDISYPASMTTEFIAVHGHSLRSLILYTFKTWPTHLHPSPADMLMSCPNLHHLSLETPIPQLLIPESKHTSLEILTLPRLSATNWEIVEPLLFQLPALRVIRARDIKWLRKGMGLKAQEAGVQGEMRDWRRRLSRRGIRVLDAEWNDID